MAKARDKQDDKQVSGQVGGNAGGVNFAADIVHQDNVPSTINFARELSDQKSEAPSGNDPDPNEYQQAGGDAKGFIENPVAGGYVSTTSILGDFVNGVDHEDAKEDVNEDDSKGSEDVQG